MTQYKKDLSNYSTSELEEYYASYHNGNFPRRYHLYTFGKLMDDQQYHDHLLNVCGWLHVPPEDRGTMLMDQKQTRWGPLPPPEGGSLVSRGWRGFKPSPRPSKK